MRRKDRSAPQQTLAASTAERIGAIVEAAEKAAVTVIDDAEAQARRHLEQAEAEADRLLADRLASLADLNDQLTAQAEAIKLEADRLLASLAEAKRRLGAAGAPAEPAPVATEPEPARSTHLTAVAMPEEPDLPAAAAVAGGEHRTPAGARLLATQMAVSGSSRAEIESRLRNGFQIEDTASILDAILGPEE